MRLFTGMDIQMANKHVKRCSTNLSLEKWRVKITMRYLYIYRGASLIAQLVKNLPAMQETPVQFLGQEDPLEKRLATHFNILGLLLWLSWQRIRLKCGRPGFDAWVGKIPWRRGRLPTPVFWPREFHWLYSPWGCKESDVTEQLSYIHASKLMLKILQARLQQYVSSDYA